MQLSASRLEQAIHRLLEGVDSSFIERLSIPEPNSGCYIWTGHVDRDGYARYGAIRIGGRPVNITVHKAALSLKLGYVPKNALHICDVRCCVNAHHLYDGTCQQNVLDARSRNRLHGQKLSLDDVATIRTRLVNEHPRAIAEDYNVNETLIYNIKAGVKWR